MRILVAGLLGAIVYYVWGMIAWMAIPLHQPTMTGLPNARAVTESLQQQNLATGVYVRPWSDNAADWHDNESQFVQDHQTGPLFSIYYQQAGAAPLDMQLMLRGFAIDLLAATLAACLLSGLSPRCGGSYARRVGFVIGLGMFVALVGHASYWNWMRFPMDYTVAFVIDVIIGWTLAGMVLAAIVGPTEETAPATTAPSAGRVVDKKRPAAKPAPVATKPTRNDALTLLAALQREARFLDIVKEPLGDYSDAQVGAAARDVLRDCGAVVDRFFDVKPIVNQEEGASVEIPQPYDANRYRLTGDASDDAHSGHLVHHGWEATQCKLPQWTGSQSAALVIAAAELEAS